MATSFLNTKMLIQITIHAERNAKKRMIVDISGFGIPLLFQRFAGDGTHVTDAFLRGITI